MLEFIQAILGIVAKAVPAAIRQNRDRKLSAIGAELFIFYVQVNEALVCAEDIVSSLETYVKRMSEHMAHGNDPYALTAGHWIVYKIERQRTNLAKIGETMQRWGGSLQIVDGQAFAKIIILMRHKVNALDALLAAMGSNKLPLSVTLEELQAFVRDALSMDYVIEGAGRQELARTIRKSAIPLDSPWDSEVYEIIENYLRIRNPRQQIAEIRKALEDIRAALEENFSITDILMRVGDRRFDLKYNGDYFW